VPHPADISSHATTLKSKIGRRSALTHQTGLEVFPHTAFRCPSPRGIHPCPACRRGHFVEPVLSVQISFGKPGITRLSISDLVPPSQMGAHPLFQVPSHSAESPAAVAKVEITHPATHRRVDLTDQPVHRNVYRVLGGLIAPEAS
jgi:hypothetical protein